MSWISISQPRLFFRYFSHSRVRFNAEILGSVANNTNKTFEDAISNNDERSENVSKYYDDIKTSVINENLNEWIKNQEKFPKGIEKDFTIFYKLSGNPMRYNIPEIPEFASKLKFKDATEEEKNKIVDYYRELVRYIYLKREKQTFQHMRPIYKKFHSIPEIKDEYLHYLIKKANIQELELLLTRQGNYYYNTPKTYSSLLDNIKIFKNSKHSIINLKRITKLLSKYNIPINNELIYKLYYTLPLDSKKFLFNSLQDKMDIDKLLEDRLNLKLNDYDLIKSKLLTNEINLSYPIYIKLVNTMIKEIRIEEGFKLINYLIIHNKIELPTPLVKLTIDLIISNEPHLAIPAALYLQRITGSSLKTYTLDKLATMITSSKVVNKEHIDLLNLILNSTTWRVKSYRKQYRKIIEDSNVEEDKEKLLKIFDNKLFKSSDELVKYEKLEELFNESYVCKDTFYKAGFDINNYEGIFKLFITYKKYYIMKTEILDEFSKISNISEFVKIWDEKIKPFNKLNKPLFMKLNRLVITDILLPQNQYFKIISFVNYLKTNYNLNLDYFAYLQVILKIIRNPEIQDKEVLKSTDLQLATLLSYCIKFSEHDILKNLLTDYPILTEILNTSHDKKNDEAFNKSWNEMVKETEWDPALPPQF
jgi:hypothetical protein